MSSIVTVDTNVNARQQAIRAEERAIIEQEGMSSVAGRFIRDPRLAGHARRIEAEYRVESRERRAAYAERHPVCQWCSMYQRAGEPFTVVADAPVHAEGASGSASCADMLARFLDDAGATLGAPASLLVSHALPMVA